MCTGVDITGVVSFASKQIHFKNQCKWPALSDLSVGGGISRWNSDRAAALSPPSDLPLMMKHSFTMPTW
uniref:Uncharacterized protein n=1 Tax=Ciona intestinalis TaxID=7719 RepID=H2XRY1_CIOIN